MTEGELKKRLETALKYVFFGYNPVLEIVEEMKADFPLIILGDEVDAAKTILEVMKWREKWLGENEHTILLLGKKQAPL